MFLGLTVNFSPVVGRLEDWLVVVYIIHGDVDMCQPSRTIPITGSHCQINGHLIRVCVHIQLSSHRHSPTVNLVRCIEVVRVQTLLDTAGEYIWRVDSDICLYVTVHRIERCGKHRIRGWPPR